MIQTLKARTNRKGQHLSEKAPVIYCLKALLLSYFLTPQMSGFFISEKTQNRPLTVTANTAATAIMF